MPAIGGHAVHFLVYKLVFLPGDSSAVVPLLPIPNRIVKGSSGDDTHLARDWDNTSSPGFFVEKIIYRKAIIRRLDRTIVNDVSF